jgi:hypothetical protein
MAKWNIEATVGRGNGAHVVVRGRESRPHGEGCRCLDSQPARYRQGERRVLVKGRIRKELVRVESDDEDTGVLTEVLRTSVVLDLAAGAVENVDKATPLTDAKGTGVT